MDEVGDVDEGDDDEDEANEEESRSERCSAEPDGGGDDDGDDENMLEKNPGGLRGRGLLGTPALDSGEENLRRKNATKEKESSSDGWSVDASVAGAIPPICTVDAEFGNAACSERSAEPFGIRGDS